MPIYYGCGPFRSISGKKIIFWPKNMPNWKSISRPNFGPIDFLDKMFVAFEKEIKGFPVLYDGHKIFVGSDYSGQHANSAYDTYSFLIMNTRNLKEWEPKRRWIRENIIGDNRRISFKNLRDAKKLDALGPILRAANEIHGVSAIFLVDKSINSLFQDSGKIDLNNPELSKYSTWKPDTFEKMLRIVHFVSFLISGLSGERQDLIWISDEDEIIANQSRMDDLIKIFGTVVGNYLAHNLGHISIGTTKLDSGSRELEDLVAIPDLCAGALCHVMNSYQHIGVELNKMLAAPPTNTPGKVLDIMNWFSDSTQNLKRIVVSIDSNPEGGLNLKSLLFHGSNAQSTN